MIYSGQELFSYTGVSRTSTFESSLMKLSNLGVSRIHQSYAHINFLTAFSDQGVPNKDPSAWLDGARPPQLRLIMSLMDSKFDKLSQKKLTN